jgi:hypothetical protein
MRIFGGIVLIVAFSLWVLYRLIVKKDLKQNLGALGVYSAFIGLWIVIYIWMIYF